MVRRDLLLPLDHLLAVVRELIRPSMSPAAFSRMLKRRGASRLKDSIPEEQGVASQRPVKNFKDYEAALVHVDVKYLPQMPDKTCRKYVVAAIDRTSRWGNVEIIQDKSARSAQGFPSRLLQRAPFKITRYVKIYNHTIPSEGHRPFRPDSGPEALATDTPSMIVAYGEADAKHPTCEI